MADVVWLLLVLLSLSLFVVTVGFTLWAESQG